MPRMWRADRWWQRLRGLLGRRPLAGDAAEGLWLSPCNSVHTFWMAYPLDVLFLGRDGEVLGWREDLSPWRTCGQRGAYATVELRAGGLSRIAPVRGEVLQWQPIET
ncbi:hypothetical protein SAMN02745674_01391 [Lysobacter spongiicola DSM 21749]|uniref:DUF192 domain-containing protein n=2 Tax=Novilysobacter TaxID=3382699 RepID=A0A1T4PYG3_9GAMM|nr:hypothetical protein SAMN02745674_01391 [Lysobacter spongiicola DSM 21749]